MLKQQRYYYYKRTDWKIASRLPRNLNTSGASVSYLSDASTGSVCDRDQSEVPQVLNSRASFSSFSDATEALLFLHFMTRRASFSSLSDASTGSVCNLSYLSDLN